jgi:signal transduction histidine kinase
MVGLLVTVAVLQYRWTTEASSAEEMRIGAELESLMTKWHGDLYGEFSAICVAMQVGPDAGARDTWNDYLERYVEWNFALPHESLPYVYRNPDLVGEIYIWETNERTEPRLFWLSLDTRKIEPIDVPREFVTLLDRLQANSASLSTALRAWQLPGQLAQPSPGINAIPPARTSGTNPIAGWQFDENVPAIVHPIFHHGADKSLSSRSPVDWIIITLDMNVLRKRVLPELSTRYFGGLEGLDYKVAVVANGPSPRTIYSSDPGFDVSQLRKIDSTMSIFGLQTTPDPGGFKQPIKNGRSLRSAEWRSLSGPVWFPVIQYELHPQSWFLEIQRRAGPLQSVIDGVRRNNLAISRFVLLLLALNITVLSLGGLRSHNFAKLQMDFVASVSHELRTPLTAIFSAGENIRDGVVSKRSDLAEYGSIVMAQSRQLMNHVDRILLFASIRSGKDRYTLRPLQVSEIFACVSTNMEPLLAEESCVLEKWVEPGLPSVLGDMLALCGCLENLLTNAVKYCGNDPHIRMFAGLGQLNNVQQEVTISVEDHGIGIAASELSEIFEPFYRSPQATEAQIHGTGLGLSLAKHLAEAMGGRLSVTSEIGVGSIFTLHLQLAPAEDHELSTVESTAQVGEGK